MTRTWKMMTVLTPSADEDDCLSNRPAPPEACPAQDEMLEAEDEARSMLPPQDGEPPSSSPHIALP